MKLIRSVVGDKLVEVCYSGGKDSDVILELTKMAGVNYEAIYKNTTIDPKGTLKHCKDNGCTIVQPKQSFFQIVERVFDTDFTWLDNQLRYEQAQYDKNNNGDGQ